MSRSGFGYSLEDAFLSHATVQPAQQPGTPPVTVKSEIVPPAAQQAPARPPGNSSETPRARTRNSHSQRSRRQQERDRRASRHSRSRLASYSSSDDSFSNSSYDETDASDDDDTDDEAPVSRPLPPPPPQPAVFTPTTAAEMSAYTVFAGRYDAASWSLPPSVTGRTLGPGGPGVPENPWPGPRGGPQGGPTPSLHMEDSRVLNGGRVPNSDFAGSFTDPNTGIVYAAYTDPMPEPKVLRDTPDLQLGKPNRMLEALTGVSALQRPVRQEIVNDFQDAMEGLLLPHSILEMQVRSETEKRDARELFFTNREAEAGYADTHWDGYIGTTFVMRPTHDTQTVRENDESNTTVLPFRQNPDGNLAVPMFRSPTEWGGALQPAVEILAEDKAYGLPHVHHDFQVDNARLQQITDSALLPSERVNHSVRATTINAAIPWETSIPAFRDSVVDRTRVSAPGLVTANAYEYSDNIRGPPVAQHERAYADSKVTARSVIPTLNMSNLMAATAVDDTSFFGDSRQVNYFNRTLDNTGAGTGATLLPQPRDSARGQDSTTLRAFGGQMHNMPHASAAFATASENTTEKSLQTLMSGKRMENIASAVTSLPVAASSGETTLEMVAQHPVYVASDVVSRPAHSVTDTYATSDSIAGNTLRGNIVAGAVGGNMSSGMASATPTYAGDSSAALLYGGLQVTAMSTGGSTLPSASNLSTKDSEAAATVRAHVRVDVASTSTNLLSTSDGKTTRDASAAAMKNTGMQNISDGIGAGAGAGSSRMQSVNEYGGETAVASLRQGGYSLGSSSSSSITPNLPSAVTSIGTADATSGAGRASVQQDFANAALQSVVQSTARDAAAGANRINVQPLATASATSLQHALSQFAGDAVSGAQRVTAQSDTTMSAMAFPSTSDRAFTEKLMVPGRVSNSRVFSWTGQSLAADAVPSIFKLAGESDGLHAQDDYTSHERVVREEYIKARPDGIADFRNMYTADGRKKDETDIWRGRSNGPSRHVIDALLHNQLYELSQQPHAGMDDATRVAYESDY